MKPIKKILLFIILCIVAALLLSTPVYATELTEDQTEMLDALNEVRQDKDLPLLVYDLDLQDEADLRVKEIVEKFSHLRPDGSLFFTIDERFTAESISKGIDNASDVVAAWLASSSDKYNLAYEPLQSIAVSIYEVDGVKYWCVAYSDTEAVSPYGATQEPEIPVNSITFTFDEEEHTVPCPSGTYKEVFSKVKDLTANDFIIKNAWGTQVFSWYSFNTSGKVDVIVNYSPVEEPEETVVIYEKTFTLNNNSYTIECLSGTYKEVFLKVKELLGDDASFTVKDNWGSTVYSWYGIHESGKVNIIVNDVEVKDPEPTVEVYTKTLLLEGESIEIECLSGTYKEVFTYLNNNGYINYSVKDNWGTTVYSWYKVTESGKCSITFN